MTTEAGPPKTAAAATDRPGRLALSLAEVVRRTGLDAKTIEALEKEFPFLNAGRAGDRVFYRPQDVEILTRARQLLEERTLTLAGIKRRLEEEFHLAPAAPVHPEKLRKALLQVREELHGLLALLGDGDRK